MVERPFSLLRSVEASSIPQNTRVYLSENPAFLLVQRLKCVFLSWRPGRFAGKPETLCDRVYKKLVVQRRSEDETTTRLISRLASGADLEEDSDQSSPDAFGVRRGRRTTSEQGMNRLDSRCQAIFCTHLCTEFGSSCAHLWCLGGIDRTR